MSATETEIFIGQTERYGVSVILHPMYHTGWQVIITPQSTDHDKPPGAMDGRTYRHKRSAIRAARRWLDVELDMDDCRRDSWRPFA